MDKFIIKGGKKLEGIMPVSGAKNSALKALVAACLTDEEVIIKNIPLISDFFVMINIIQELGGEVKVAGHTVTIRVKKFSNHKISLAEAAEIRTSVMLIAPLLAREKIAYIPNPGGDRIGARPIDRIVDGLKAMGAKIIYDKTDGYFYATTQGLCGADYEFKKNTHMGTETILIASVLAKGKTILRNAAAEPEVDELIVLLTKMGAKIKRTEKRTIEIEGVSKLHGTTVTIGPDRNEIVTFAIAAAITNGRITVPDVTTKNLAIFLDIFKKAGGGIDRSKEGLTFYKKQKLESVDIITNFYPGFMTDWQAPWAILMTQADGVSTIHETVYENRFGYIKELSKMGAKIKLFQPEVLDNKNFYNFNSSDGEILDHAIKIYGPADLHNAVMQISDLRAGATLVLAGLVAKGESVIFGIKHVDRGYESFDKRLRALGADIKRVSKE